MERIDLAVYGLVIIVVLIVGLSLGIRTTGYFGLDETESLVEVSGPCWTCSENTVQPRVEPQDKQLVIKNINLNTT